jgi:hypothetical protein
MAVRAAAEGDEMSGMQGGGTAAVAERPAGAGTVFPDDPRHQELTVGFNQRCCRGCRSRRECGRVRTG